MDAPERRKLAFGFICPDGLDPLVDVDGPATSSDNGVEISLTDEERLRGTNS